MSNEINFKDYLLRNEKWLTLENEEKGQHAVDGILDDSEISIFFSNAHIEFDSDAAGDAILSEKEFENWYSANESAISSYYDSIGVELNETSKKTMLGSMLEFMGVNADIIATSQGENGTKLQDMDITELQKSSFVNVVKEDAIFDFGQDYVDGAREALKQWDYNEDGATSVDEMAQSISNTYSNVFEGNEPLSELAQQIADSQSEIYTRYAGKDGILDEYEYAEALNSDENNILLDQYWELKDTQDALKGETDLQGLQRYDLNGDGKINPLEVYQKKSELYSKLYEGDEDKIREAKKIALDQAIMLNKYAREDGNISTEKYAEALRSESYIGKTNEYLALNGIESKITPQMALQLNFESQLKELYEQLDEATDESTRDSINAKIKELQHKHNIEMKKLNIQDIINSTSDLDEEQKAELQGLYTKLTNATSKDERDSILAEIKQKCQEYNVPDSTMTKLDIEAIDIEFNTELNELYQQLSKTSTSEEYDSINMEISKRIQSYNKESADLRLKNMINSSDFSDDIKAELQDLYTKLSEAASPEARDSISAQIQQKFQEYELPKEFKTSLDVEAIRSASGSDLGKLYEQLAEASEEAEKDKLWAQIKEVTTNYNHEEAKLVTQDVINTLDLSNEQKEELKNLYTTLSASTSPEAKEQTYALIDEFCKLYNIPEDKTTFLDLQSLIIERDNRLNELYGQLSEVTGDEERNAIKQEIKAVTEEYSQQAYDLNLKLADLIKH